jgi:hypothetical protein
MPGRGAAKFTVEMLPTAVIADNATETAVFATMREGFPNNVYGIKGTFSDGARPYYGVTYCPGTTLWASQEDRWDGSQMQFVTDANGEWSGYLFVRLEQGAPTGDVLFRVSGIPLKPIEDAGATVGPWYPVTALLPAEAGHLAGHVYLDPACTQPASRVVVRALDVQGGVVGAYLSQSSAIPDGQNRNDTGYFELGAPPGKVVALEGRTRYPTSTVPSDTPVPLYTRTRGPWIVRATESASVDVQWGDAGGDNALGWDDAALCARLAAGLDEAPSDTLHRADVDGDGAVTLDDVTLLAQALNAS